MTSDPTEASKHPAAKYCADMVYWWYDDWFLPSKNELSLLYTNSGAIWGFNPHNINSYWSSTQANNGITWYQSFYNGSIFYFDKRFDGFIRCIRKI